MQIFESVGCPTCDRDIVVIVENNKITSHGVCGYCDNTHSAERLQFQEDAQRMEDQFMDLLSYEGPEAPGDCGCGECVTKTDDMFVAVTKEVQAFYVVLWDVYFDEMYQLHLEEMAEFDYRQRLRRAAHIEANGDTTFYGGPEGGE